MKRGDANRSAGLSFSCFQFSTFSNYLIHLIPSTEALANLYICPVALFGGLGCLHRKPCRTVTQIESYLGISQRILIKSGWGSRRDNDTVMGMFIVKLDVSAEPQESVPSVAFQGDASTRRGGRLLGAGSGYIRPLDQMYIFVDTRCLCIWLSLFILFVI